MKIIYTTQEIFGEEEPEIIEDTMLYEPKVGWKQRMKGIGETPKYKFETPKTLPPNLENLTLISVPPETELDVLNENIEKDYKEYLKLQKTLTEFDTTLEGIPPNIQPSVIANYNKEIAKFNSLINTLQTDITKRDQIYSVQRKRNFIREKHLTEQEVISGKTILFGTKETGWEERMRMGEIPEYKLSSFVSKADESGIKDTADAFILGGSRILQQSKDYFINALPNMIFAPLKSNQLYGVNITDKQREKINIGNKKKLEKYNEGYLRSQENYYKWLKDNPQLQPRKEWADGVIASVKKDPTILLDPAYWGYVAADSAAFTIGVMGTTYTVAQLTGNPLLGMAAGVAVATPMQTQDLYEDLVASGATPEQAARLAAPVGGIIASVEVMGDLPILASVSKPFKKLLFGKIRKTVANKVAAKLLQSKITTFATIEASETLEEVVQAGIQDACVMTVDENRKFLGDLKEIVATTPMATLPFALFGVSADINTQNKAKAKIKARIDKLINDRLLRDVIKIQLEEQGMIPKEPKVVTEAMKTEPKEPNFENLKEKQTLIDKTGTEYEIQKIRKEGVPARWEYELKNKETKLVQIRPLGEVERYYKIIGEPAPVTPKAEPKEPTISEELEAKREMLRKRGVKEELLTDEFVKKATIKILEKADVTDEELTSEEAKQLETLRKARIVPEEEITKEKVLEKVEKPTKVEAREPWQMTKKEFVKEFERYNKLTLKAEKTPERRMTAEETALMVKDWKTYSKSRGYTDKEITDFEKWLELNGVEFGFDYKDVSPEKIWEQHIQKAIKEGKPIPLGERARVKPPTKEVALEEEPEFRKDVKIKRIPAKKPKEPIPERLRIPYIKTIWEIKSAEDRIELSRDIWWDLPISVELQNKYPDLMKKIPKAKLMEKKVSIIPEEDGVSLVEEAKIETIWAGEDIGGTSEEITEGTMEAFEKSSIFLFDKPFSELKKSELRKVLETSKQALPDSTGEYINKIGTPAKGLELRPTADEHARFIFGGFEKGLLTDSHLLVLDEAVSKKVLSDLIGKYKNARVKEVQSETVSYKQAEKIVDKEIENYKKRFAKDFPKTKEIVSKEDIEKSTPLWIQGHKIAEEYTPSLTYFTDGKIQIAIDTDKVSFLNKHFPEAEIKSTGSEKPVVFMEGKDLKAVVMPVRVEEFPFKITGEPTIISTGRVEPVHYTKGEKESIEKIEKVKAETEEAYNKLIDERIAELKEEGFKGVEKGGVKKDEEGKVIGRYPAVSKNPKWYRDFYKEHKKRPNISDLREIAKDQLLHGHEEDYGIVPPSEIYQKLNSQIESYDAIIDTLKEGKEIKVKPTIKKISKAKPTIKPKITPEEIAERKKLIKKIHTIKSAKGLTDKEYTQIKRRVKEKYGIPWIHLPKLTLEQLRDVAKSMERARPKQIGYQKVITLKTEKKIQSLKDSLIEKFQMTEEAYKEVLKDLGIHKKEPRYIDGKHFITEQKGKELIYRLIDESNILKITEPLRIALEKNPEIKGLADIIIERIRLEGERTLRDPSDLNSARSYFQILETISGAPFFTLYQDLINTHLENRAGLNHLINEFDEYRDIIKNEDALKRVEDWILAKSNLKGKPETPADITPEEIKMAKKIEGILKDYQARARTEKFLDNIEHPEDMPQYLEYKKEIDKAKDIYESKGYDDLVKYMETQKWGTIKSGYDPLQVLSTKIRRAYKSKGLSLIFGKQHIKVRKDIEYKEQDTNIITRLLAYKRQMDNLSTMSPKVRALITLANKNLDKFKNPHRVRNNLQIFFRELKGYDRQAGWFERGINRIYSQAMITIIMGSPPLSFRNLGQNFGLGHDKAMLVDPRNKKLTPEEIDYLDTYVQQAEFMRVDWFMTGEKPLPGLKFLTDIIKRVNLYPRSDIANRHWGFWGKINQVRMAFADIDKNSTNKQISKAMQKAKFSDFSLLEQKRALEILSKDGKKAMEKYIAKVYVDDVHFLYERAQRSIAEMGKYGKVFGNLMLFPRAYWEKLAKFSKKMTGKNIPFREKLRAFKVISSILIGGALVSVAYRKVTGRREPPYDPLILLAYEPGGLMLSTVEAMSDVYSNTIMAVRGDQRALAFLTTAIPNLADHLLPFYNYTLRGYEAFLGDPLANKNIDKLALKKLRQLINKEYQIRGGVHSVERNAIEKWQYFLCGTGVDVTIKEREAKEKKLMKERKGMREFSTQDIYKDLKLENIYKELEKGFDTSDIYKELGL